MNQSNWESRNGSFFPHSFPNWTVQAITKGLVKYVLRVKTYLESKTTKEFIIDNNATKYDLESSAQLTSESFCQVAQKVLRLQQSKSHLN